MSDEAFVCVRVERVLIQSVSVHFEVGLNHRVKLREENDECAFRQMDKTKDFI